MQICVCTGNTIRSSADSLWTDRLTIHCAVLGLLVRCHSNCNAMVRNVSIL